MRGQTRYALLLPACRFSVTVFHARNRNKRAERLDTTKGAISKMENRKTRYNEDNLETWANALTCQPADLITRAPPSKDQPLTLAELVERATPEARTLVETFLKTGTKK
jgi:transcriptional regulator with XRE-family HTH domain